MVYLHNPTCRTTRHAKLGSIIIFECRVVRHEISYDTIFTKKCRIV
jgi:hypothetical protein